MRGDRVAVAVQRSELAPHREMFAWHAGFSRRRPQSRSNGQLGNGSTTNSNVPVAVTSSVLNSLDVTLVAAGDEDSCALTNTGRLFAWGDNTNGELGIGSTGGTFTTPQEVLPPTGFIWTSVSSNSSGEDVLAIATPVPGPRTTSLIAAAGLAGALLRRRSGPPLPAWRERG